MSESGFDEKLRSHYDGRSMSDERLALLAALVEPRIGAPPAAPAVRARGVFAASGGLSRAAAILLLIVSGALAMQWSAAQRSASRLSTRIDELEHRSQQLQADLALARASATNAPPSESSAEGARYVAVRIASSNCPYCGRTRGLFEKLVEQHASDNVLFLSLDVSSPAERKRSERLACGLGLKWAEHDCENCCAIRLFDREKKELVASQFAMGSSEDFEHTLDQILKKPGG